MQDPLAHPAQRLDAVRWAGDDAAGGVAERHQPLGAVEGQAVADLRDQAVGIDADGLGIGVDRPDRGVEVVDRNQVGDPVLQQGGELDRLVVVGDDDGAAPSPAPPLAPAPPATADRLTSTGAARVISFPTRARTHPTYAPRRAGDAHDVATTPVNLPTNSWELSTTIVPSRPETCKNLSKTANLPALNTTYALI